MIEHLFLYLVVFLGLVFASIHDIRKREVSNWLNFALISFVLVYRLVYALNINDMSYFYYGLLGIIVFFILGEILYYSGGFGGGDVKLLRVFGGIFPGSSYFMFAFYSITFLFLIMAIGAIYSLIYGAVLAVKERKRFGKEFKKMLRSNRNYFLISVIFSIFVSFFVYNLIYWLLVFIFFIGFVFLYTYLKALDCCMIKLTSYRELTEGDWIVNDLRVGGKIIRKSIHGLSFEQIKLIKKYRKSVWIKNGIPFVPVFLISFSIMVLFYSKLLARAYVLSALFS